MSWQRRNDEGRHGHDFDMDDNASDDINNVHQNLLQDSASQKTESSTKVYSHLQAMAPLASNLKLL